MTPATLIQIAYRKLVNNPVGASATEDPLSFNQTYGLPPEDGTRVRGGPDWVRSERYTVTAVAEGRVDAATLAGPMLLALLENRLGLKVHVQSEEFPVWALKVARGGLKIKPAEPGSCVSLPSNPGAMNEEAWKQFREANGAKPVCWISTAPVPPNYRDTSVGGSMGQLTDILSQLSFMPGFSTARGPLTASLDGLRVLNKTDIPETQKFDFVLEYGADPGSLGRGGAPTATDQPIAPLGPTIFDALGKLGLTLERGKAPREYIVIDHIERPSAN